MNNVWVLHPGYGFKDEMALEKAAMGRFFEGRHTHVLQDIPTGSVVVPRFRMLPFARELQDEVEAKGCVLLNSFSQHRFAADLGAWYDAMREITPRSWNDVSLVDPDCPDGYILKGETNSARDRWLTHCFAPTFQDIGRVAANLRADSLISSQTIWIREFTPLRAFFDDVKGMPVSEEFRVFFLDGQEVSRGFYWMNHLADLNDRGVFPNPDDIDAGLLRQVGERLKGRIRFAAVDVARRQDGSWCVIEVNDGVMSGLCGNDANAVFEALSLS